MKNWIRVLTGLLTAGMIISAAACAEKKNVAGTVGTSGASIETDMLESLSDIEKRQLISDDIPALDFDGETFTMLVATEHLYDAWVEEMVGDIVEDEIVKRNDTIAERFNVVIEEAVHSDYTTLSTWLKNSINSQEDAYDLYLGHAVQSGADALNGYFVNWYDIPYMDLEKPWYPQLAVKNLTLNNIMLLGVSDLAISATENTYCMFYDKVMAETYNIPDVYTLVNNGEWTVDKLKALTKDVYEDQNGDSRVNEGDYYGFTSNCYSSSNTYLWAFDQPIFIVDENYQVEMTFNSEKTVQILEKVRDLYYGDRGSIIFADHNKAYEYFRNGNALFVNGFIGHSISYFRDYENDYGIIPYPKWNEEQEEYYTMVDGNFSIIACPQTVTNPELVGAVTHALSAYSWKNVIPQYYDVALKVKGARDDESVALLDRILEGRVIDFPYLYDGWKGYVFSFQDLTAKGSNAQFSSMYQSKVKAVTRHYENVVALFLEYGQ